MRGYSINNYLNFNLNYKLTIDYILETHPHKLNKDLIIKEQDMV
jgi:hypothetical protein